MTEEQEVNVGGQGISQSGDDHSKIKANGVARENGDVGAEAKDDSGAADLGAGDGAALEEERKVNGESPVTVTEGEGEKNRKDAVSNGSGEEGTETEPVDVVLREGVPGQNGSGSVADASEVVAGAVAQNGVVENEIRHDDHEVSANAVAEELVTDHDDFVVVGAADVQNGVASEDETGGDVNAKVVEDREIPAGDENGIVVTDVADENKSNRDFEATATSTDENGVNDVKGESESLSDKDVERENPDSADVSDEKDIVANEKSDVEDVGEKKEVPVDVDSVSAATDAKEGASEKGQVEPVSDAGGGVQNGLALPELEVNECAEENEIPIEGEPGSKSGSDPKGPEGENLSALNNGDGNVVSDVVAESNHEPSVDVCEMRNNAIDSVSEPSINVCEMKNNAGDNEVDSSSNTVKSDGTPPSVNLSEVKENAVERESEPCVVSEMNNGYVSEVKDNTGERGSGAVQSEAEPSSDAVQSEAEPSNDAVRREAEPSSDAVRSEAEPSSDAVWREAEPSSDAVRREAEPSSDAVQSEAEPSSDAVQSEAEPSNDAVRREAEPSNDAVSEVKTNAVESESEPLNSAGQSESEPSVVSERKNNAVEFEADLPNGTLKSEGEPSIDVPEIKTNAVESEGKPSNGTVQSEGKPSVDMSEMKPNAMESSNGTKQSDGEISVDLSEMKTNAVESEVEASVEGVLSVEREDSSDHGDGDSRQATDALDGQDMGTEVVKRPFYYLIRVPRYDDDDNIKEKIKNALHHVEEKTKIRDAIRAENQTMKARCKDCIQEVRNAQTEERAARDILKSKRQEMDAVQSTVNRLNNAISVGDIDGKIRNMEHMIQHETLPLNEEKQLIRQIKQLKQNREELSSNIKKQDQSQQSPAHNDSIEENFKRLQLLKKEIEAARNNVLKTEAATKAARKKYDDECSKLNESIARFKAADEIRQEAYAKLHASKKQLHEKSKYFWEYKNASTKGQELAAEGKKEELQCFCVDQVERMMELWNKNDEFRRDYIRCNTRSTLRRLQTLDGRSLGPDEEPPIIPNALTEKTLKNNSVISQSPLEQEKKSISTEPVIIKDEPVSKPAVQNTERSQTKKAKRPTKPAPLEKPVARWGDESDEDTKEEPVRTREEGEQILKAEMARKEEEAAQLKEKRRLEEIEKAKEALQRKKRNAEKAQQRAAIKAQKEAEQKEKEREKRARKKERRKAGPADTAESAEPESAPCTETLTRSVEECDQSEKPVEVTKKPQKPSQFTKQTKAKSLPPALRNRGKRRIQSWMWVLIAVLLVVALFYIGNSSSLKSSLEGFGF